MTKQEVEKAISGIRAYVPTMGIRPTGESSAKYGPCDVCGKSCDAIYTLSDLNPNPRKPAAVTYGHAACLEDKQHNGAR